MLVEWVSVSGGVAILLDVVFGTGCDVDLVVSRPRPGQDHQIFGSSGKGGCFYPWPENYDAIGAAQRAMSGGDLKRIKTIRISLVSPTDWLLIHQKIRSRCIHIS